MKPAGWISGNDWHFQQLSEISGDPWKQKRAEPYASPGSGPGHGLLKREPLSIVITYTLSCTLETGRSENVKHERWWGNRCLSPFKYKFMVPMGEQHMNLSATLASRDGPWTRIWAGPPEDGEEQQKAQPASGLGTPWTPPGQDDWLYGACATVERRAHSLCELPGSHSKAEFSDSQAPMNSCMGFAAGLKPCCHLRECLSCLVSLW